MLTNPITNNKINWQVLPDAKSVAKTAVDMILKIATNYTAKTGTFRLVLAGGTTPKLIYQLLAKQLYDFTLWEIYLGDERCLPKYDNERNSEMIWQNLISQINIPDTNVHFIPAEIGAQAAALNYATLIAKKLPFHLVLLGVGEDGHTASLFPGHIHQQQLLVHAIYNAPKPPKERVSLSQYTLSQTQNLIILATGNSKRNAIIQWQQGKQLPISSIIALNNTTVLLDKEASN